MKANKLITCMCLWLAVLALGRPVLSRAESIKLEGQSMVLFLDENPLALRIEDRSGRELLATDGPIRFTTVSGRKVSRFVLWWFWSPGVSRPWTIAERVIAASAEGGILKADLGRDRTVLVRLQAWFLDERTLRLEMEVKERPEVNRMQIAFKRMAEDRYYGMGERFNAVEHSLSRMRNWSEEGGLGLFQLSKIWPSAPFNPFPKGPDMTYYPVPFFLNPGRGYGLLLDDAHYSVFDFGKADRQKLKIENWNRRLNLLIFFGPEPLQVIETMTKHTGRITVPAPWVFAPMNAAVEGEERDLEVAALLRREKIPTSALWSEDWWWRTEWEVNRQRYPHYEDMISRLHADGFRVLGYFQPYIGAKTAVFKEGDRLGYFTKDNRGRSYVFLLGNAKKAQVDLSNPLAGAWWKESFFAKVEKMGVDGWMHDFGEHTPPDSVSFDGSLGWDLHNLYPVLWAKLGREFWDQTRPDGDYCFYIRGGYTGSQRYASVMWTGDQNSSFERLDGLPSNLPAIISAGISGHPVVTTDIAGYNCFVNRSADRELFMRWTELGALLPVMRLHRGNAEICHHWSFDQDAETLAHYKKYAILHTALFPYIYTLVHEAAAKGWPVVRHLMLHYPDDPKTWKLDYQYLLGDRLLVAPVLERGAQKWRLYLPEGGWAHFWSGKIYRGPGEVEVAAEPGFIPLFVKTGKILPMYDSPIDTLVKEGREDLMGWDDANRSLLAVFFGEGGDEYQLWDGTLLICSRPDRAAAGICRMDGSPVARKFSYQFR